MNGLMLHCGAESATWDDVCNVPLPQRTSSYSPVPYKDMVEMCVERNMKEFGIGEADQKWSFGLQTRNEIVGARFFAVCRLEVSDGDEPWALCLGLRGSTDKSIKNGFAAGASVFVCDNLCFSGDSYTYTRKHTGEAYEDFRKMLYMGIADSSVSFNRMDADLKKLQGVGCETDRGYELIGRAMGNNVLAPQEANEAIRQWKTPKHEEFEDRNLYSLYNAYTEAAKKTRSPSRTFEKYSGIHGFFQSEAEDVDYFFRPSH